MAPLPTGDRGRAVRWPGASDAVLEIRQIPGNQKGDSLVYGLPTHTACDVPAGRVRSAGRATWRRSGRKESNRERSIERPWCPVARQGGASMLWR